MDKQLQEIYDNAQKAEACCSGLNWLTQFETFEEAEDDSNAPGYFLWYSKNVIRGQWKLGEKAIAKNAWASYCYADEVLKARFKLGEEAISKFAGESHLYARFVLKGRFKLGEKAIVDAESDWLTCSYAINVVKGRFKLGEKAIAKNLFYQDRYENFLETLKN